MDNLRIATTDLIFPPASGAQLKFFQAKTRLENAVGMVGTEVGVLFRFTERNKEAKRSGVEVRSVPNSAQKRREP